MESSGRHTNSQVRQSIPGLELLAQAKFCSRLARVSSFHGCPFIDVDRDFVGRNDGCGLSVRQRKNRL